MDVQSPEIPVVLRAALQEIEANRLRSIEGAGLPFYYDSAMVWRLSFEDLSDPALIASDAFAITFGNPENGELQILDWTNEPIYSLNERGLFRFSKSTDIYARFFFHLVRGQQGRFILLEDETDMEQTVPWLAENATGMSVQDGKKLVAGLLKPLQIGPSTAAGEKRFRATIVFKNALFRSDILISPNGLVRLENEDLKAEDLPIG